MENNSKKTQRFLFICFMLLSLSNVNNASAQPKETNPLLDFKWNLISLLGDSPVQDMAEKQPHILFFPGKPILVKGNTGCNTLSGSVVFSGKSSLTFSKMAVTRKLCLGGASSLEMKLLTALEKSSRWQLEGDTLVFLNNKVVMAKWKGIVP